MTSTIAHIAQQAVVRRAQERLLLIGEMRDADRLRHSGKSQREIAGILRTTQPRVGRLLRGAQQLGDAPTPEEVILRATVDATARAALVKQLCGLEYTFSDSTTRRAQHGANGTWSQVIAAHELGLLQDKEYERVKMAVNPPHTAVASKR